MPRAAQLIVVTLVAIAIAAVSVEPARAQSYPARPVSVIVAQAPGGQTDVIARIVGVRLSELWKQPFVIVNQGGAGGTIGAGLVAKAPADGYTVLAGGTYNLALAPALMRDLPYDPARDFVPLRAVVRVPFALAVHARVPAETVSELVAYARAHPGRLNYGSSGAGSSSALAAEWFKSDAGVDIVHVPFRGAAPAVSALVAGQIDVLFADLALLLPHARSGTVRLLAAAGARRAPAAPELPTIAEQGIPGFDVSPWYGFAAPAGISPEIVARWTQALGEVVRAPEVRRQFAQLGYEVLDDAAGDLGPILRADVARYAALVRKTGIRAEP